MSSAVDGECNSEFPAELCIADDWQLLIGTDQLSTNEDAFCSCLVGLMYQMAIVIVCLVDV